MKNPSRIDSPKLNSPIRNGHPRYHKQRKIVVKRSIWSKW